jgi:hypothetical protein
MSTASPIDQYGNKSGESTYGSGQSDSGKSPLSMSLGFLKTLTEKKNTRGWYACYEYYLPTNEVQSMDRPQKGEDQNLIASLH